MSSGYDEIPDRAYSDYTGGTNEERAMEKQGFEIILRNSRDHDH